MSMRFQYRAAGPIAAASILALLTACSRTQQDWRVAQQAGTAPAYQVFVAHHPGSELAAVARQRIAQLTEQAAWRQAKQANTAAAYQAYLAKYPDGVWSQDARIRMESGALTGLTEAHPDENRGRSKGPLMPGATGTAPQEPRPPATPTGTGVAATVTPASTGHSGRYAVQLGAFSSAANAKIAQGRISSRFRAQLRGRTVRVVPVSVAGHKLYRLEAGVADRATAHRLCHEIQQHSQGCFPVP